MWAYALIAVFLLVAIGLQVWYARVYWAQSEKFTRTVWCVNIGLLLVLLAGLGWLVYRQAVM